MPLATVYSRVNLGIDAPLVRVETHLSGGLPSFNIVGLPEASVREARDRVRSALVNSGYRFPAGRITVNLAPADLPKEGGRFDLPIAVGILAADGRLDGVALERCELLGELSLGGALRPVVGSLPAAINAAEADRDLILPAANVDAAALCKQARLIPAASLNAALAHLNGSEVIPVWHSDIDQEAIEYPDIADVAGQQSAVNGLMIAAAGSHNLLLSGPPGTGKTLLASRLPGILPPLSEAEMLESMAVYSASLTEPSPRHARRRPFRNPHHSATAAALVGGGQPPRPGEISLAHCGVLFLDELPEYPRRVLDSMRQPLESGEVVISRARIKLRFPARFQLVAAMNPCPCGFYGDHCQSCRCSPDQVARYRSRISGPLLDRIDMHIRMSRPDPRDLFLPQTANATPQLRQQVSDCRLRQLQRQNCPNQQLSVADTRRYCALTDQDREMLLEAAARFHMSARAQHRILRVARTIADLDAAADIETPHLLQAMNFRGDGIG